MPLPCSMGTVMGTVSAIIPNIQGLPTWIDHIESSPISHPKANTGTKGPDSSGPFFFVFAMHKGREAKASVLSSELGRTKERASEEAQKQF